MVGSPRKLDSWSCKLIGSYAKGPCVAAHRPGDVLRVKVLRIHEKPTGDIAHLIRNYYIAYLLHSLHVNHRIVSL